jgi:hypothetical protein
MRNNGWRVLLRLAHLDKRGPAVVAIPTLSHQVLAERVGTTCPRIKCIHGAVQYCTLFQ